MLPLLFLSSRRTTVTKQLILFDTINKPLQTEFSRILFELNYFHGINIPDLQYSIGVLNIQTLLIFNKLMFVLELTLTKSQRLHKKSKTASFLSRIVMSESSQKKKPNVEKEREELHKKIEKALNTEHKLLEAPSMRGAILSQLLTFIGAALVYWWFSYRSSNEQK